MTCWCGHPNPHFEPAAGPCDGSGDVDCFCGGDQCVCHNHGEAECPGCANCSGTPIDPDDESAGED